MQRQTDLDRQPRREPVPGTLADMDAGRLASGVVLLIGLWFICSPWVYGFTGNTGGAWNRVAVGIAIAALAAVRLAGFTRTWWVSGLNVALGIWAIFSPWIFGYSHNMGAVWNSVILGVVVAVLSAFSAAVGAYGSLRPRRHV